MTEQPGPTDLALDEGDEFPDMMVGEEVDPEHDLDLDAFHEEEGDE